MLKRFFAILMLLIFPLFSQGSLVDEINQQLLETETKRAELERQAQEYQQIINQKQGEIKSLKNQIAIFNARINKLEIEIEITEDDIDKTKLEILQLEYGIGQTSNEIISQKDNLAKVIQTIAEYDGISELEIILQSDNLSDFFNQLSYIENLQNGIQEKVDQLKSLKEKLGQDKDIQENKKESLENLKRQLDQQKLSLASQKNSKESLLKYTKGEESKYQNLLNKIEEQKKSLLGDINRLRQQKAAELARLKEKQEKPPAEYWASLNWYYQQDNPSWAKTTVGMSDSEMEDYGCAITSVAMILTYHGETINPGQLAKEPIFYYDLIIWPKTWRGVQLVYNTYRAEVDWFRIDRELGAGNPVIVRIQANGKSGGHYVVIHHKTKDGRYVVHDPLFGDNLYLDSSQAFISSLYETTTSINQMVVYH